MGSFFKKLMRGISSLLRGIFKVIGKIFSALFGGATAPKESNDKINESLLQTRAEPAKAAPVLYGRGRVAGNRLYQNVNPRDPSKLLTVLSFGVGQISEVSAVRIDGTKVCDVLGSTIAQTAAINAKYDAEIQAITSQTSQGWWDLTNPAATASINSRREAEINALVSNAGAVQVNKWVQLECRLGSTAQSAMSVVQSNSSELNATSTGAGHVLLAVVQTKDDSTSDFQSAVADIKIDFVGRSIVDLRSMCIVNGCDNGPSVLWDYLTNKDYGCNYTATELDFSSFVKCANQVAIGFNGAVDQSKSRKTNVESICSSFGGELTTVNGKITLVLDYAQTEYVQIPEGDIVASLSHEQDSITNRFNICDVNWPNPAVDYQTQTLRYPPNVDSDAMVIARGPIVKKFDLPYCTTKTDVDRMASYYLNQRLIDETITVNLIGHAVALEVGNVISITSPKKGWTNKLWRIVRTDKKLEQGAVNQIQIQAKEYKPEVYASVYTGAIIPDAVTSLGSNNTMPTNLRAQARGADVGYCVSLYWDYVGNFLTGNRFEVSYQPQGKSWVLYDDGVIGNKCDVYGLPAGIVCNFRVRNVSTFGVPGPYVYLNNINVNNAVAMPVVTNLRLVNKVSDAEPTFANSRDFVIAWDDMRNSMIVVDQFAGDASGAAQASKFIKCYRVEVLEGNRLKKAYDVSDPQFTYTFEMNAADGLSRNNTFRVRTVSHYNDVSSPSELIAKNPQCKAVTGMTDTAVMGNVFLKWAAPNDADYVGVLIYASDKPNVELTPANFKSRTYITNSTSIDFNYLKGATAFIKYGAYDEFGEDEIVWTEQAVLTKGWPTESQLDKDLRDKINAPITGDRIDQSSLENIIQGSANLNSWVKSASGDSLAVFNEAVIVNQNEISVSLKSSTPVSALYRGEVRAEFDVDSVGGGHFLLVKRFTPDVSGNEWAFIDVAADKARQRICVDLGRYMGAGLETITFKHMTADVNRTVKVRTELVSVNVNPNSHPIRLAKLETLDQINAVDQKAMNAINVLKASVNDSSVALNGRIDTVNSLIDGAISSSIESLRVDFNNTNKATNDRINTVQSDLNKTISANYTSLNTTIVNNDKKVTALDTKLNETKVTLNNAITTNSNQTSASLTLLDDRIDSVTTTVSQNKASTDSAFASLKTTLEATIASTKQSTKLEINASVDAKLGASYVVKTESNGKFAGFGLLNGGNAGSTFRIQADKFLIDDGTNGDAPFIVEGGNTYIKSALIKNATIVNAHIANGAITSAKIADASIDNAKIGNYMMSSNYDWNNGDIRGWYLSKNYNNSGGLFVCRNAILHSVDSRYGTFNSATINSASINDAAINRGSIQDAWINRGSINNLTANNVTINGDCRILGTLTVGQINGNFVDAQGIADVQDQTLYFGANWQRGRCLMVSGIEVGATGWEQTVGNDGRTTQYTGTGTCTIWVNGNIVSQRTATQKGGGETNWRSVGATVYIPAGQAPNVRIRFEGAGWSKYIYGGIAIIV